MKVAGWFAPWSRMVSLRSEARGWPILVKAPELWVNVVRLWVGSGPERAEGVGGTRSDRGTRKGGSTRPVLVVQYQ